MSVLVSPCKTPVHKSGVFFPLLCQLFLITYLSNILNETLSVCGGGGRILLMCLEAQQVKAVATQVWGGVNPNPRTNMKLEPDI